jgi:hypothetical protein
MIDVHLPTTDRRELLLTRYTEPEPELSLLLEKLKLELPAQPPPKITAGPVPPIPLFPGWATASRTGSSTPHHWGLDRQAGGHRGRGQTAGSEPGKGMV